MYLGIDIGGTKTLVAVLDGHGVIKEKLKIPTNPDYDEFLKELAKTVESLTTDDFIAAGIGAPGRIDRHEGILVDCGNLVWENVPLRADIEKISGCPTVLDNDANLAGLSEAMLVKAEFSRVLYVTISTGIGTGFIADGAIDPTVADMEGGQMVIEHKGKRVKWESFASGHAIVERFGKKAAEITDDATWKRIAYDWSLGFYELIAIVEPEVIVIGGSVGTYFDRYAGFLKAELEKFNNPMVPVPQLRQAQRPEEAVIYGCYDLARSVYANVTH
jgi:predicted NBD/HSP70 family sugar kinase